MMSERSLLASSAEKGELTVESLRISGGKRLTGNVKVQGAKNAGQKILPAIAAFSSRVVIEN